MTTTHILETAGADIAYDVRGPLPTADGRPPLFMIGQPMAASGFATLASHFPDRTVVTYDPRGLGRSVREDGRVDHTPTVQAEDVHAVIEALGGGAVEMFASSGGAVTALALVAAYPGDVTTLVAHEPQESADTFTGRTAVATADLLGQQATVFPSHHGGFLGGEFGYAGRPEAFAGKLREVLDGAQ
jgi:pimeloyl-ACP methyl ester carboxylesterase